jgi:Na+-translocating ferredoxin:NAD+ oxidoreductase RnfE subunit
MVMLVLVSVIDMVMAVFTHEMFSALCKFCRANGDGIAVLLTSR